MSQGNQKGKINPKYFFKKIVEAGIKLTWLVARDKNKNPEEF